MGRFTNLGLVVGAVALIVIGAAAQTGTISLGRPGAASHGSVSARHASAAPPPSPLRSPIPSPAQPVATPPTAGGGGGDGGDGGD